MKKKFLAIAVAAALTLALPVLAWGADSPTGNTATNDEEVSFTIIAGTITGTDGGLTVQVADRQASNVVLSATDVLLGSFEAYTYGDYAVSDLTLIFYVGTKYDGADATIYIEHADGSTEICYDVVTDGTVTGYIDSLSYFSVVVDTGTGGDGDGSDSPSTDGGSTSPQTGIDTTALVAVTSVAALGAGVVFMTLRKRLAE